MNTEFNTLVRIMATRCMLAAEYFCSGSVSKDAYGHYGLATPIYTHFTVSLAYSCTISELTIVVSHTALRRCLSSSSISGSNQLHPFASVLTEQITCRENSQCSQSSSSIVSDGKSREYRILCWIGFTGQRTSERYD